MSQHSRSEPFDLQVARGQIPFHSSVNIFGFQVAATSAQYLVWENVADYVYPTSASTLTLVSTSASDTSALSVLISGLDINYNPASEVLALNGVTNVTTVNSYFRVNTMVCTNGLNVGVITLKQSANILAQINAGIGKSQAALFTVPAGNSFFATRFTGFSNEAGGGNNFSSWRARLSNATTGQVLYILQSPFISTYNIQRVTPFGYVEKSDLQWQISTGTGTSPVGANVEGYLVQNNYP
jgi:hypothetical protein